MSYLNAFLNDNRTQAEKIQEETARIKEATARAKAKLQLFKMFNAGASVEEMTAFCMNSVLGKKELSELCWELKKIANTESNLREWADL